MAGLLDRTWKGSYKNLLILGDAVWNGITGTRVQLKDGAGQTTPLYLSASAIGIHTGQKLYFGDNSDKYIYNSDTNTLEITAPKVVVNGTLKPDVLSAVSIIGTNITGTTIKGANVSLSGTIKAVTASSTTVKGTNFLATGKISGLSIKGDIVVPTGGNIRLPSGGAVILKTGTQITTSGNYILFTVSTALVALMNDRAFYPNVGNTYDLGKNGGGRWLNLYSASVVTKNTTVSNLTAYGGTASLATAKGNLCKFNYLHALTEIIASGCSVWLDGSKTYSIRKDGTVIKFAMGATILNLNASNEIYPNTTKTGKIGTSTKVFNEATINTINCVSHLLLEGSMNARSLPSSSDGLSTGDIYQIAGELKVVT